MKKYRARVEYAAIETITYVIEVEDETKLDFVIEDLIARGEHECAIETNRMIEAQENSGTISSIEDITEIAPIRPNLKLV